MEERRRSPRTSPIRVDAPPYVLLTFDGGSIKTRLLNSSEGGLAVESRYPLPTDGPLYCGVPSLGVYSRGRVVHCEDEFLKHRAGIEFLASLWPSD